MEGSVLKNDMCRSGPKVSVLISTYNRPQYLREALQSVLCQNYKNLEVIVVNDGGVNVGDVVKSFGDSRITFINRSENKGKALSLNQALTRAEGKYIAYLDDDDLYYPHHIETLVEALENQTDCQAAYTDLYKTYCKALPDGSRQVLSKVVEISRDFDRFLMLYFNHVLHVSLMHHRSLFEKTGLYNDQLNILIDWDMTRRLVFFTDFFHVKDVTGEFYSSVGESDRISVRCREDEGEYLRNVLAIRTKRPAKPWPKLDDMGIIFVPEHLNKQAGETISRIWRHTFYPYKLYLPLPRNDFAKLNIDMPNVIFVPVERSFSLAEQVDAALAVCEGEYVAIVSDGLSIEDMWVENAVYALINSSGRHEGIRLSGSEHGRRGLVVGKNELEAARKRFPQMSVLESLSAANIVLREPAAEELPFQFDDLLRQGQLAERNGSWTEAAEIFEYIAKHYHNELWMKTLAARCYYKAGDHNKAMELSMQINQERPTVDTLLLEAKVRRERKDFNSAIGMLRRAEQVLVSHGDTSVLTNVSN